jgi:hypothetical protein
MVDPAHSLLLFTRRAMLMVLVSSTTAAHVTAQDLYVTAGGAVNSREAGWSPSPATPSAPAASNVPSIIGGVGIWLPNDLAVEGSLSITAAQSIVWHYGYQFGGNADKLTEDRDLPLIGLLRIAPLRRKRASIEPVLGGGVNFHRGATFTTADCGSGSRPTPCVPVTPPRSDEVQTTANWVVTFGADVAVRVSSRVSLAPGFRVSLIRREVFMTGYDHRGPYSGGGFSWSLGVAARYSIHSAHSSTSQGR